MTGGFRIVFGPLALCAVVTYFSSQPSFGEEKSTEQGKAFALEFPLIALEPKISGKDMADNEDAIFVQAVRPAAAVQIKTDVPLHFEGYRSPVDLVVPAGTIFVQAISSNQEFYCAVTVVKPPSFGSGYESGVCFHDLSSDGSFDELSLIATPGRRVRTPYELAFRKPSTRLPASVSYERMSEDKIPLLELRGVFQNEGGFLSIRPGAISLGLCWPAELRIPEQSGYTNYSNFCGLPDWESNKKSLKDEDVMRGRHSISLSEGTKDKITWGPIAIAYTVLEKRRISANTEAAMPLGPFTVRAKSTFMLGLDFRNAIYVLEVKPAMDKTADRPGGGI